MLRRPLISLLLATAAFTTMALSGCSTGAPPGLAPSGGAAPGASPASSAKPARSAAAVPAVPAAASFSIPTSCPSSAEVGAVMGTPAPPDPHQTATADSLLCVYLSPTNNGLIVDIEPAKGVTPATVEAQLTVHAASGSEFAPVSGFGDAAFSLTKNGAVCGLFVLRGGSVINMAGPGSTLDAYERLAKILLGV